MNLNVSFTGLDNTLRIHILTCIRYLLFLKNICAGAGTCVKGTKTMFYIKKYLFNCLVEAV